jgi:hypothetical protein
MSNRMAQRILAAVGSAALLALFGLFLVLLSLAVSWVTTRPDPWEPDGDPCCGHPDDRGDIVHGALGGAALAVGAALILACALALGFWAVRQRWPASRPLAVVPAGFVVLAVGALAVLTLRNPGGPRVDCDRFRFDRDAWYGVDHEAAERQALGIEQCGTLIGRTRAQVRALIGAPESQVHGEDYWSYDTLELRFHDDKVDHARAGII